MLMFKKMLQPMFKIGHRGACGHAPENTRASFIKAVELGVDGVEFDIQLSADGEPVVIHDETIDRTTNGRGFVADYSFWELQQFDAGGGERIPHLRDIFTLIDKKCALLIELKIDAVMAVEKIIREEVARGWNYQQIWLLAFDHELLAKAHMLNKNLQLCASLEEMPRNLAEINEIKQKTGATAIGPSIDIVDKTLLQTAKKLDMRVFAWTINDPKLIKYAVDSGVDAIISDFPERII